ncbi:MAG: hypothetical protein VKN56_12910 [Cyanobacteriota bacterium]|nr:hypothetical protein [Cyanobacteriota bacterium]
MSRHPHSYIDDLSGKSSSEPMVLYRGRKRRFLLLGSLNVLLTNLVLQGLLLILPIGLATLLSQAVNMGLGYYLYGKGVFRVSGLTRRSAVGYAFMSFFLWWLNWCGISLMAGNGIGKSLAALIMVPILPIISFPIQKHLVFAS